MNADKKAKVVTVVVLAGALAIVLGQKYGWKMPNVKVSDLAPKSGHAPKPDPTPQDAIYAMLDAARVGDVKTYLAAYTGQMETALKQSIAETTESGFAKYLKNQNAAIKGIAISEPQTLTDREVKVRVEYVYQDRNEAQMMFLEKAPGRLEDRARGGRSGSRRWCLTARRCSDSTREGRRQTAHLDSYFFGSNTAFSSR